MDTEVTVQDRECFLRDAKSTRNQLELELERALEKCAKAAARADNYAEMVVEAQNKVITSRHNLMAAQAKAACRELEFNIKR